MASTTCIVHKENVVGCESSKEVPGENDDPSFPSGDEGRHYGGSSSLGCKASTDAEIEPAGGPPVKHHDFCHSTGEVTTAEIFGDSNKEEKKVNTTASLQDIAVELPATEEDEHSIAKKESQAWQIQPDRDPCRSGIRSNDISGDSGKRDRPGSGGLSQDYEVWRGSSVPENLNDIGSWNTCCGSSQCSNENSSAGVSGTDTNSGSLGNGFMTGPGGPPDIFDWDPFFCNACSALVGASAKEAASSKKGVQFFKCHISTDSCHCSSNNVFRYTRSY